MGVNVAGLFHLTQGLLPMLIASGSVDDPARVVNVGSVMGEATMGDGAYSYSASKAAVSPDQDLGKELAGHHITVNALAPGPFVSRMTAFATADKTCATRSARMCPWAASAPTQTSRAACSFSAVAAVPM